MDNYRPTWAEIDLGAIRKNIGAMKSLIPNDTVIMAVVKANAYGHGMIQVAKACIQAGAGYLGVATLEEALELRGNGINEPVLVLGYIPAEAAEKVATNRIDATVFDLTTARNLSKAAVACSQQVNLHIKIDTGMSRIGFPPNRESVQAVKEIYSLPGIVLKGVFSHFATADAEDKSFSREQMRLFNDFVTSLEQEGINISLQHMANSAAIMDIPESHFNMVRAGIATYGLYPSPQVNKEKLRLVPAMRLISKIVHLQRIADGYTVSYGRTYRADKEILVATVPIGYADGYSRLLSNRIWARVRDYKVPQIGTICMDQCMFDVSNVKDVKEGDEIILFGGPEDGITVDNVADTIGTINYEVVCAVSARVPRIYI